MRYENTENDELILKVDWVDLSGTEGLDPNAEDYVSQLEVRAVLAQEMYLETMKSVTELENECTYEQIAAARGIEGVLVENLPDGSILAEMKRDSKAADNLFESNARISANYDQRRRVLGDDLKPIVECADDLSDALVFLTEITPYGEIKEDGHAHYFLEKGGKTVYNCAETYGLFSVMMGGEFSMPMLVEAPVDLSTEEKRQVFFKKGETPEVNNYFLSNPSEMVQREAMVKYAMVRMDRTLH
jgi:hypothetical protein